MIETLLKVAVESGEAGMEGGMKPLEQSDLEKFADTVDGEKSSDVWHKFEELPEGESSEANWQDFDEDTAGKIEDPRGDLERQGEFKKNPESNWPKPSYADLASNMTTRNEDLKDKEHPVTGVPFKEKPITDAEGKEDTGVFPEFDSECDVQLPEELEQASDKEQFDECNKQLKDKVENDPEFAKKFTPEQLEQIKNGDTPDGYTWHHNEEKGKMQLVDSETHAKTGHTGGKVIWGGGSENR